MAIKKQKLSSTNPLLNSPLPLRPRSSGLLHDARPEWDDMFIRKVIAFCEENGIDPSSEDVLAQLVVLLLTSYVDAFQSEKRGANSIQLTEDRQQAQWELIELYIAGNVARIRKGEKPHSDAEFVRRLLSHAGRSKLPLHYRKKSVPSERTLCRELHTARGRLMLFTDVQQEILCRLGLDKQLLSAAANFSILTSSEKASKETRQK